MPFENIHTEFPPTTHTNVTAKSMPIHTTQYCLPGQHVPLNKGFLCQLPATNTIRSQ